MKLTSAKKLPMPPLQGRRRSRVVRHARYQIGRPYSPLSRDVNVLARDRARLLLPSSADDAGDCGGLALARLRDRARLLLPSSAGDCGGLALSRLGGLLSPGGDALLEEAVVGTARKSGLMRKRAKFPD